MNLGDFIITKKRLIIALGAVIFVAELLVFLPFLKTGGGKTVSLPATQRKIKLGDARLVLQTEKDSVTVGENFRVAVNLNSPRINTGAVDLILEFDPSLFQVASLEHVPDDGRGGLFSEYPQWRFDNNLGKVYISATTSLDDEKGVEGEMVVAWIVFTPLKSGQGEIVFLFSPGSTTDSNVVGAGTTEDILGAVENLQITIQ